VSAEITSISIVDLEASCEAVSEPDGPEIPEDREWLALREA